MWTPPGRMKPPQSGRPERAETKNLQSFLLLFDFAVLSQSNFNLMWTGATDTFAQSSARGVCFLARSIFPVAGLCAGCLGLELKRSNHCNDSYS